MDYDKLIDAVKLCGSTPKIDQCKQCAYWSGGDMSKCIPRMTTAAATALSTLRAENEKLRVEAEGMRSNWYKSVEEIKKLRAELEQVKAERDAAIEDLHGKCSACANYTPYHNDGPCATCKFEIDCFVPEKATDKWQWRGPVKED